MEKLLIKSEVLKTWNICNIYYEQIILLLESTD